MPVANTRAPPNATCSAADTGGVSMYFQRTQVITPSSTITTPWRPRSRSRTTGSGTAACGRCRPAWSSVRRSPPRITARRARSGCRYRTAPRRSPSRCRRRSTPPADQKRLPRVAGGERGGEHRRQRGHRAVHQPGQTRLDQAQHEHRLRVRVLSRHHVAGQVFVRAARRRGARAPPRRRQGRPAACGSNVGVRSAAWR